MNSKLTISGMFASFTAGLTVILWNLKVILFYLSDLPSFFDLTEITTANIVAILTISSLVPARGYISLARIVSRIKDYFGSAASMHKS